MCMFQQENIHPLDIADLSSAKILTHMDRQDNNDQTDFTKLALATLAGVLLLGGSVYAAYQYSQRKSGNIILPGGVTYTGPSPTSIATQQPPTAPIRFTADPSVSWKIQPGIIFPFSFSYPSTLPLVVFPGDPTDSVAISWGNIPPQQNVLLNMELIEKRDPQYLNQPKIEYVRNWYKFFNGLKGVAKLDPFTNTNGLKGYKASYLNHANTAPNVDVFFEVPNDSTMMIHMANGILDPTLFDRMIDSLKWLPPTPKK